MTSRVMKSESYCSSLLVHMKELYDRNQLCDYSLLTRNDEFQVHSVVLCSASNFFKALICEGSMGDARYHVHAFDGDCLQAVIHFLYTGDLVLSEANIWNILAISTQFEIPEISELCQAFVQDLSGQSQATNKTVTSKTSWKNTAQAITSVAEDVRGNLLNQRDFVGTTILGSIKKEIVDDSGHQSDGAPEMPGGFDDDNDDDNDGGDMDFVDRDADFTPKTRRSSSRSKAQTPKTTPKGRGRPKKGKAKQSQAEPSPGIPTEMPEKPASGRGRKRKRPDNTSASSWMEPAESSVAGNVGNSETLPSASTVAIEQKLHYCCFCGAGFKHFSTLSMHKNNSHFSFCYRREMDRMVCHRARQRCLYRAVLDGPLRQYPCYACKKSWRFNREFNTHTQKHHPLRTTYYRCSTCPSAKVFTSSKLLYVHSFRRHDKPPHSTKDTAKKLCKCQQCGRRFRHRTTLLLHKQSRHKDKQAKRLSNKQTVWKCDEEGCGFSGDSGAALAEHMSTAHPHVKFYVTPRSKGFDMASCDDQVPAPSNQHAASINANVPLGKTEKRFSCEQCTFSTPYRYNLNRHLELSHTPNRWHCTECPCTYVYRQDLEEHIEMAHGNPRTCQYCGKRYKSRRGLQEHEAEHQRGLPFKCSEPGCTKMFRRKTQLDGHINAVHQNYQPYHCSVESCDRSFAHKASLLTHEKDCKGIVPLACPVEGCAHIALTRAGLKEHKLAKHSSKEFKCPACGKCFTWRASLARHLKKNHE